MIRDGNIIYINGAQQLLNNAKRIIEEIVDYVEGIEGGLFDYEERFIYRELERFVLNYEGFLRLLRRGT